MLYNRELKQVQKSTQCISCAYFDKRKKKCNGIGKNCFEYDPITQTCLDPITRLTIKFD